MALPAVVSDPALQQNLDFINRRIDELRQFFFWGTGSPEGVVTASPPAAYLNFAGGANTTWYLKESGVSTNTGWIPK